MKYVDPSHISSYFFTRSKYVFRFNKRVEVAYAILHEMEIWLQSSDAIYERVIKRNGPVMSLRQMRKIMQTMAEGKLITARRGWGYYKDATVKFITIRQILVALGYEVEHNELPKTKVDYLQKILYDFLDTSGIRLQTEVDKLLGLTSRTAVKKRGLKTKAKINGEQITKDIQEDKK